MNGGDGSRAILGLALVVGGATLAWLVFTNHIGAGSTPLTSSAPGQTNQQTAASAGQAFTKASMNVANTGSGGGGGQRT